MRHIKKQNKLEWFSWDFPSYIPQNVIDLVNRDFPEDYIDKYPMPTGSSLEGLKIWNTIIHDPTMKDPWLKIVELSKDAPALPVAILEGCRIAFDDYREHRERAKQLTDKAIKISQHAATIHKLSKEFMAVAGTPNHSKILIDGQYYSAEKAWYAIEDNLKALKPFIDLSTTASTETNDQIASALKGRKQNPRTDFLRAFFQVVVDRYHLKITNPMTEYILPQIIAVLMPDQPLIEPSQIREVLEIYSAKDSTSERIANPS